jgi:hypothetical protein
MDQIGQSLIGEFLSNKLVIKVYNDRGHLYLLNNSVTFLTFRREFNKSRFPISFQIIRYSKRRFFIILLLYFKKLKYAKCKDIISFIFKINLIYRIF